MAQSGGSASSDAQWPAGWYQDPDYGVAWLRWFDGHYWTPIRTEAPPVGFPMPPPPSETVALSEPIPEPRSVAEVQASRAQVQERKDRRMLREGFLAFANLLLAFTFLLPWLDLPIVDGSGASATLPGYKLPSAAQQLAFFSGDFASVQAANFLRLLVYGTLVCAVAACVLGVAGTTVRELALSAVRCEVDEPFVHRGVRLLAVELSRVEVLAHACTQVTRDAASFPGLEVFLVDPRSA